MHGVERYELLPHRNVRWVLEEKIDKGIRFQADYVVVYDGDGAGRVTWRSLSGNMGNEGDVAILPAANGGSEIRYRERVEPDLPISSLMAKLIQPLVARIECGTTRRFLDRVEQQLSDFSN